eukprot:Mycagemm_TRINITY_DN9934_c0_g1::TRINITY_DN9934_c0_g1_i1::g.3329::m.3329 type:complete len:109 gc:universal TRINITY_DN9934_c0_g1_i1:429-103(-)
MLAGLAALLVARLELTGLCRNHQDTNVGLGHARDHVGHKVLVARGIQNSVTLLGRLKVRASDLDGLALCTLLLNGIHDVSIEPRATVVLLCLLLVLFHRTLVDLASQE